MPIQMPSNMLGTQRGPLDPAGAMARGDEMNLRKQSIQRGQQQGVLNQQNIDKGFRSAQAAQKTAKYEKIRPFLQALAPLVAAYPNTVEGEGKAAADKQANELYKEIVKAHYVPPGTTDTFDFNWAKARVDGAIELEKTLARASKAQAERGFNVPSGGAVVSASGEELYKNRGGGSGMYTKSDQFEMDQREREKPRLARQEEHGKAIDMVIGFKAQGRDPFTIRKWLKESGFDEGEIKMILKDSHVGSELPGTTSASR